MLVTKESRNDKKQMLARDEHNQMVAFSANEELSPGTLVKVEYLSVNGNTIIGRQI